MALQLERLPRIEKRRPHRAIKRWARLLLRSKTGTVGLAIVAAVIVMAVFASLLAPYDPNEMNPANMLQPPVWVDGEQLPIFLGLII